MTETPQGLLDRLEGVIERMRLSVFEASQERAFARLEGWADELEEALRDALAWVSVPTEPRLMCEESSSERGRCIFHFESRSPDGDGPSMRSLASGVCVERPAGKQASSAKGAASGEALRAGSEPADSLPSLAVAVAPPPQENLEMTQREASLNRDLSALVVHRGLVLRALQRLVEVTQRIIERPMWSEFPDLQAAYLEAERVQKEYPAAPLQPHTDLQAKLDNALETYRTVAHALQADVIRLNDLRKAAVGRLHPEPQDPLTALQAGLVGQWRNEAVLVLNHSEIHEREGAAALRRCADELERAIQALRPPGEIATPAPPWQPIETSPKDGTLVDVWLGDGDEEDCAFYCTPGTRRSTGWAWKEGKLRPAMGLALPVVTVRPTHWMSLPLPPAPPQAPEQEPK